jgi:hypothetical protein
MLVEDNEIKEQEFYTLLNLFGVVEKWNQQNIIYYSLKWVIKNY